MKNFEQPPAGGQKKSEDDSVEKEKIPEAAKKKAAMESVEEPEEPEKPDVGDKDLENLRERLIKINLNKKPTEEIPGVEAKSVVDSVEEDDFAAQMKAAMESVEDPEEPEKSDVGDKDPENLMKRLIRINLNKKPEEEIPVVDSGHEFDLSEKEAEKFPAIDIKYETEEYDEIKKQFDPIYKFWQDKSVDLEDINFGYKIIFEVEKNSKGGKSGNLTTSFNYHDYLRIRQEMSEEDKKDCDGKWSNQDQGNWDSPNLSTNFWERLKEGGDLHEYNDEFREFYHKVLKEEFPDEYAQAVESGEVDRMFEGLHSEKESLAEPVNSDVINITEESEEESGLILEAGVEPGTEEEKEFKDKIRLAREKYIESLLNKDDVDEAKKEYLVAINEYRGKMLEEKEAELGNGHEAKEKLEKYAKELLVETTVKEATEIYNLKTDKQAEKSSWIMKKGLEAVSWYRKQPTRIKILVSALFLSGGLAAGTYGGAVGLAMGGGAVIGKALQRVLGGAGTALGLETWMKRSQEKETEKKFLKQFDGEAMFNSLKEQNNELDKKIFELTNKKKGEEIRRSSIAAVAGVLVGSGTVSKAIAEHIPDGWKENIANFLHISSESSTPSDVVSVDSNATEAIPGDVTNSSGVISADDKIAEVVAEAKNIQEIKQGVADKFGLEAEDLKDITSDKNVGVDDIIKIQSKKLGGFDIKEPLSAEDFKSLQDEDNFLLIRKILADGKPSKIELDIIKSQLPEKIKLTLLDDSANQAENLENIQKFSTSNPKILAGLDEITGREEIINIVKIPKGGNISEALGKAMREDSAITILNPDGTKILDFDANLVHPGDTVIETADGEISVLKTSGIEVEKGASLEGIYDKIEANLEKQGVPQEVQDYFNLNREESGFLGRIDKNEAKQASKFWKSLNENDKNSFENLSEKNKADFLKDKIEETPALTVEDVVEEDPVKPEPEIKTKIENLPVEPGAEIPPPRDKIDEELRKWVLEPKTETLSPQPEVGGSVNNLDKATDTAEIEAEKSIIKLMSDEKQLQGQEANKVIEFFKDKAPLGETNDPQTAIDYNNAIEFEPYEGSTENLSPDLQQVVENYNKEIEKISNSIDHLVNSDNSDTAREAWDSRTYLSNKNIEEKLNNVGLNEQDANIYDELEDADNSTGHMSAKFFKSLKVHQIELVEDMEKAYDQKEIFTSKGKFKKDFLKFAESNVEAKELVDKYNIKTEAAAEYEKWAKSYDPDKVRSELLEKTKKVSELADKQDTGSLTQEFIKDNFTEKQEIQDSFAEIVREELKTKNESLQKLCFDRLIVQNKQISRYYLTEMEKGNSEKALKKIGNYFRLGLQQTPFVKSGTSSTRIPALNNWAQNNLFDSKISYSQLLKN